MDLKAVGLALLRILLTADVVIITIWGGLPWACVVPLAVLGIISSISHTPWMAGRNRSGAMGLVIAWLCSLVVVVAIFKVGPVLTWDNFYAVLAWLMSATMLPPGPYPAPGRLKTGWKLLGMIWVFFGAFVWLAESYTGNSPGKFYLGLLLILALLILCKCWFQLHPVLIQTVNVLILLSIGLPLTDWLISSFSRHRQKPGPEDRLYSYEKGSQDPGGYARWCAAFDDELSKQAREVLLPGAADGALFHPKPDSQTRFFHSRVSINHLGFRGREFNPDKGDAYRIVALGESTTFGITMNADDKPWPELLEQMIRERLKPRRPVEVINAGVIASDLVANLNRLQREILPLKPDMIISYHGYNGFNLIRGVVPLSSTIDPPVYHARPLKLLADAEYRIRLVCAGQREQRILSVQSSSFSDPLQTDYARLYRQLIQLAQTNQIHLVLANYSMAVTDESNPSVVDFYRKRFPAVIWWIKMNQVHSTIVGQLTRQYPDVCFVDTRPHLDGEYDKFIDLIHFTGEGDRQMAETMFAGITGILEKDLGRPGPVGEAPVAP